MKKFISLLFLAFIFSVPANALEKCVVASKEEFLDTVEKNTKEIYLATTEQLQTFLFNVNKARREAKLFLLEADALIVGELNNGSVGMVLIKDGCVVPGTIATGTLEATRAFLIQINSEDLIKFIGDDI